MILRWAVIVSVALVACSACSGKGAVAPAEKKVDLDADPLALLPPSPLAVADLEARAITDSGASGAQVAALAARFVPIGDPTVFDATRDVDRIVLGAYATGSVDVAAVLTGRFDEAKIATVTHRADGAPITRGLYADHTTYTAGAVQYAVLTPKTAVCGTGDGLRRVLDRVKAGALDRALPPWMTQTLETPGAQIAVAADFADHPVASAAAGAIDLSWLKTVRVARVLGNFEPPGLNVAATLTYADPQQAQAAVAGVHVIEGWLKVLGPALGGVRVQNLQVGAEADDVRCKFALDDQTLRAVLALAPRFLPPPP